MATKSQFASVKLPADFVDEARASARVFSRSVAGQLEYWARLGKSFEEAPGFTMTRARDALAGVFDAEDLTFDERRYYADLFADRLENPSNEEAAEMRALTSAAGAVGYDDDGRLVRVERDGSRTVIEQ